MDDATSGPVDSGAVDSGAVDSGAVDSGAVDGALPSSAGAAAQVFVADLDALAVDPADARHLVQVLRLRPGETVVAADGRGRWRTCAFRGAGANSAGGPVLEATGPVVTVAAPDPAVTVGFVPVKGGRPEWVVQKLTEAGVDRIAVLGSTRTVVRWDGDRLAKAMDRLARVAREAAAQSRRVWLPELAAFGGPGVLATHMAPARLALAHPGGPPLAADTAAVAVGPEGGWDDAEVAGAPCVGLGPTILRAETAAMAAGLLMCALRAGVVAPAAGPPPGGAPGAPSGGDSCNHHAE